MIRLVRPLSNPNDIAGARLGRYTVVRALGAGGMAELFLARADGVGGFAKLVALKRILPHKANNERFVRMLLNEAKLVASLDHPNIAHVHDIDIDQGQYFFVMEYVHGHDLRRVQHAAPAHRLELHNVLHIGIGIAAGLHHAHEARDSTGKSLEIVHRDVSPSNVLVSYEGAVKLVDFGVAKAASMISETREGVIKGKYGYMSPEQCLGDPLDRRSDLFAVGIILWELVTGRRLYKGNGELATLQRVVYTDAPPPSQFVGDLPRRLDEIIMRALSRDKEQRYQTAQELQLDLERFALEHRLSVSAVAMAQEMRKLFRDRIDAWQHASSMGQSLADHLAEVGSDDAIDSSDEAGGLDDVLADLEAGHRGSAATAVGKFPQRPPQRASTPDLSARSNTYRVRRVNPRTLLAASTAALLVLGGIAAWFAIAPQRKPIAEANAGVAPETAAAHAGSASDGSASDGSANDAASAGSANAGSANAGSANHAASDGSADDGSASDGSANDGSASDGSAVVAAAEPDEPGEAIEIELEEVDAVGDDPADEREAGTRRPQRGQRNERRHPKKSDGTTGQATAAEPDTSVEPNPGAGDSGVVPPPDRTPPPVVIRPDAGPAPGTVDANGVRAVVKEHLGQIKDCVARARMENRDLRGKVTLRISLAPTGKVTQTSVAASSGATSTLETCFTKAVASWTFPAPAGGVRAVISYPFSF